MSKHALEAFTDSLAQQYTPLGVEVNIVEPGNYNSDIARNAAQRAGGEEGLRRSEDCTRWSADRSKYKDPDEVAAAVEHALFDPQPKRRYMVVPDQHEGEITIRKQIAAAGAAQRGPALHLRSRRARQDARRGARRFAPEDAVTDRAAGPGNGYSTLAILTILPFAFSSFGSLTTVT